MPSNFHAERLSWMNERLLIASRRRTSDGYALACGWAQGWSIWSVYGRLGSWSVAGGLDTGFGVEGERSDSFEDGFMLGVRKLVRSMRHNLKGVSL